MPPVVPTTRRRGTASRLVAGAGSVAALLSAFYGLKIGLPRLDDSREYWGALPSTLRDDPVADLYGFGQPLWIALRGSVGAGDRYAVVADDEDQHEIRNYAAYSLLPGIQVSQPADADVVIYYRAPPPDDGCVSVGEDVCIVRSAP
jgi:hypothetical protein